MKNKSLATLGLLALLASASAFGQNGQPRSKVDIPFEFRIGTMVMPAGEYQVSLVFGSYSSLLSFDCSRCRAHAFAMTYNVGGGHNARTEGRLVFNRYGDTYFLAEVWTSGSAVGNAVIKTEAEREIARITPPAQTRHVILARR